MFTFNFTKQQLASLLPSNRYIDHWYNALTSILPSYNITTPERVAAFISQCAHESAEFTVLQENLNYSPAGLERVFKKYFVTAEQVLKYANNPKAIASRVYANRMGNGPEETGDGYTFRGRGLIQLTGRENYSWFAESIQTPVEEIPEYLLTFEGSVQSACWFWDTNNLNSYADKLDLYGLTKAINGGLHGFEDRKRRFNAALQLFRGAK
jgi:putative chitinase